MKTMSFLGLYLLLIQDIFLRVPTTGIVYYVKPTSPVDTKCPGHPCETLKHYLENVNITINQQENVTMIFMSGNHKVYFEYGTDPITVPIMNMKGESQGVVVSGNKSFITFSNSITEVSLTNIAIKQWFLDVTNSTNTIQMSRFMMSPIQHHHSELFPTMNTNVRFHSCKFQDSLLSLTGDRINITLENCTLTRSPLYVYLSGVSQLTVTNQSLARNTQMSIFSVRFDSCEFRDGSLFLENRRASVSIENCSLTRNPVTLKYSNIIFLGVSQLSDTIQSSAIFSYFSNITLSGVVTFANNSGIRGGAMALYSSTLNVAPGANVSFINNSAKETGGAIFIYPGLIPDQMLYLVHLTEDIIPQCFYQLLNCTASASYIFSFANNSAVNGGHDIYGASLQFHQSTGMCNLTVNINDTGLSSVSSDPTRVCLCDSNGIPQCKNDEYIFRDYTVYPGEILTVSAIVVGGDFGATRGAVHAHFLSSGYPSLPSLTSTAQYSQVIDNVTHCSNLTYSLYNYMYTQYNIKMLLTTIYTSEMETITWCNGNDHLCLHTTPVQFTFRLFPCPIGYTSSGESPVCDCDPVLTGNNMKCEIINGRGIFSWNGNLWVSFDGGSFAYSHYCPYNYCNVKKQQIDLEDDSDIQCAFNRAGRLCGGCKNNYSLAIGSSHCIHCPNNNNLALLIFFAGAGFLLVIVISVFNLTVTQGMINGLIFYANIVWAHQGLLFPQQTEANADAFILMTIGKTFIAWLNLDFGIQTCFFDGLNAFWKTWLQYLFPFYTAGLFLIGLRYSSKLSKLFGGRSVPTLATLLFLSYTKLFRNIITTLELSHLTNYVYTIGNKSSYYVWSIDGRLEYGKFPHITLLLMAIGCLLILWLPYTLLLFLMQWLRRTPNLTISRWITIYKPVIDAYFAPLKDKHHYWFGVLLLSRGILLLISSLTANINPAISPFLLHSMAILLLCYMNFKQVYRKKSVLILESAFLINLIILTGGTMYYHDSNSSEKGTLICLSIGIAFIKFCGIIIWSILRVFPSCLCCQPHRAQYENIETDDQSAQLFQGREIIQDNDELRDSILNDSQLLPTY